MTVTLKMLGWKDGVWVYNAELIIPIKNPIGQKERPFGDTIAGDMPVR